MINTVNEKLKYDVDLHSFDIFDTLITRKTLDPKGIFSIMQDKLVNDKKFSYLPNYFKYNFYKLRVNAEECLRASTDQETQDITLDGIYRILSFNNGLSSESEFMLKNLEIETESINLIPIEENIKKVRSLVNSGKNVILISDMYHSSEHIRQLLLGIDPVFENIKIYVSSESKKCKQTGDFYEYVKIKENKEYSNWYHYGDNAHADVKMAKKKGINAKCYKYCDILPIENNILYSFPENAYMQLSAGASKNCRLLLCRDAKYEFGVSYAGPVFFSYVTWILEQSIQRGYNRLYFIARDGYVLKEMADIIIEKCGYDIKTYYIYGSRDAWRLSSLIDEKIDFNRIFNCMDIDSIPKIAELFHISENQLKKFIPQKLKNCSKPFSEEIRNKIKETLSQNDDFNKLILDISTKERELVCGYLQQEIDFSDDNFAFVEFKGSGVTQDSLNDIISTFYGNSIKTFFMFLDRDQFKQTSTKFVFFPNMNCSHYSFESLLRAPHGQTVGYKTDNYKYFPLFEEGESDAIKSWGIDSYIQGIKDYTKSFLESLIKNDIQHIDLSLYCSFYKYLIETADKQIADDFGSIPFSIGFRNKNIVEVAPKITLKEILNVIFTGRDFKTCNMKISLKRSNVVLGLLMRAALKLRVRYCFSRATNTAYIRIFGVKFGLRSLLMYDKRK